MPWRMPSRLGWSASRLVTWVIAKTKTRSKNSSSGVTGCSSSDVSALAMTRVCRSGDRADSASRRGKARWAVVYLAAPLLGPAFAAPLAIESRLSDGGETSVDYEGVAGDVGGVVRGKKGDRCGNLFGERLPSDWDHRRHHRFDLKVGHAREYGVVEAGGHPAWTDAVGADALPAVVGRQLPGEVDDRGLRCVVRGCRGLALCDGD